MKSKNCVITGEKIGLYSKWSGPLKSGAAESCERQNRNFPLPSCFATSWSGSWETMQPRITST
jgi:hypothetical protein